MNTLSWMIYLADVIAGANELVVFTAFLCGTSAVAGGIVGLTAWNDGADLLATKLWRIAKWGGGLCVALSLLTVAIPSQNTIYAIAASEMGETALKSETGGKAVQALNAWLDRQIEGEPEQ